MHRGVQCYTIREFLKDRKQIEESFKRVRETGYDCVQVGNLPIPHDDLMKILDGLGLHCCSSSGNYDEMLAGRGFAEAIAAAKIRRTTLIAIGSIPAPLRETREGYKQFAAGMNKIAAELKKEGYSLNYHPHSFEFISFGGGKNGMDILFDETDPESVFFMLDTHWLAVAGVNPPDWIRRAKGRMPLIHFKDYSVLGGVKAVEGISKAFSEVGEGNLDWPAIIAACREINVEYAVVEQDTCNGSPFDSLAISYKNMVAFNV